MAKPIVILGQYKGIRVPAPDLNVTKEEIDTELARAAKLAASSWEKETEPAEVGDQVVIDYEGFIDGKSFAGGKGTDYALELGSGIFIPGFEEQLVGVHKGDEVQVSVTFPDDYAGKDLAGKPAVFQVTAKEIHHREIPELTDEIVQKVSDQNTVEEFIKYVTNEIMAKKAQDAMQEQEDYVVAKLIENSEVTIPRGDVEKRAKEIKQSMENELAKQGSNLQQYMQTYGMDDQTLHENLYHDARMMLEGQAVLDAIAEKEGYTYTQEELDAAVKDMAEQYKMKESKLRKMIGDNGLQMLGRDILSSKAMDFVLSNMIEVDGSEL